MLEARDVSYTIGGRLLVEHVSLALQPGKLLAIIGPNGAGKSTLLRLLAGEIRPSSGDILLDGRGLAQISAAELASRRAVVPQSSVLSFPFTALEVVLLGATVPGFGVEQGRARNVARRALAVVDMSGFEDRLFTELSGGEKQRVSVARALCQLEAAAAPDRSELTLLLDEPTANLDIAHQIVVLDEARRQAQSGLAVLVILHDLNLAAAYADEIVLMSNGRIVTAGSPIDVFRAETLSEVFRCAVRVGESPASGRPYMLPIG